MSAFFRLMPVFDDDTLTLDIASHDDFCFTLGSRFAEPVPTPVVFRVDVESGGRVWPTLFLPEPVFRADFLEHLRAAGVSNIDDYPVRFDGADGAAHQAGYRAVNIIGNVACADLARSRYEAFEGMHFFDELVIDADKAGAANCFRLAEASEYIILGRSVAEHLELSRFPDVTLVPVAS